MVAVDIANLAGIKAKAPRDANARVALLMGVEALASRFAKEGLAGRLQASAATQQLHAPVAFEQIE